jgi:uncharacterized protein (DUF488 family)
MARDDSVGPPPSGDVSRADVSPIFTIGHSVHSDAAFLELLHRYDVTNVLDIRSSPYSRHAPQFNRQNLQRFLDTSGIRYSFGGRTLGGRPTDMALYVSGQVSYEKMAMAESFVVSVRRVAVAARSARVALLCSESDPIECHRFLLVGRALSIRAIEVQHIISDGRLESHSQAEERMISTLGLQQRDIFDHSDVLMSAYRAQAARCAYAFATPAAHLERFG